MFAPLENAKFAQSSSLSISTAEAQLLATPHLNTRATSSTNQKQPWQRSLETRMLGRLCSWRPSWPWPWSCHPIRRKHRVLFFSLVFLHNFLNVISRVISRDILLGIVQMLTALTCVISLMAPAISRRALGPVRRLRTSTLLQRASLLTSAAALVKCCGGRKGLM